MVTQQIYGAFESSYAGYGDGGGFHKPPDDIEALLWVLIDRNKRDASGTPQEVRTVHFQSVG
jgi:hypothetical protein